MWGIGPLLKCDHAQPLLAYSQILPSARESLVCLERYGDLQARALLVSQTHMLSA